MHQITILIRTEGLGDIVWTPAPDLVTRFNDDLGSSILPAAKVLQELAQALSLRLNIPEPTMEYLRRVWDAIPGYGLTPNHLEFFESFRKVIEQHRLETLGRTLACNTPEQTFEVDGNGTYDPQ